MATKSKQLNDWLVALSPLGNTVFLSYIICVHLNKQTHDFNFRSTTRTATTTFIPYSKNYLEQCVQAFGTMISGMVWVDKRRL